MRKLIQKWLGITSEVYWPTPIDSAGMNIQQSVTHNMDVALIVYPIKGGYIVRQEAQIRNQNTGRQQTDRADVVFMADAEAVKNHLISIHAQLSLGLDK